MLISRLPPGSKDDDVRAAGVCVCVCVCGDIIHGLRMMTSVRKGVPFGMCAAPDAFRTAHGRIFLTLCARKSNKNSKATLNTITTCERKT